MKINASMSITVPTVQYGSSLINARVEIDTVDDHFLIADHIGREDYSPAEARTATVQMALALLQEQKDALEGKPASFFSMPQFPPSTRK